MAERSCSYASAVRAEGSGRKPAFGSPFACRFRAERERAESGFFIPDGENIFLYYVEMCQYASVRNTDAWAQGPVVFFLCGANSIRIGDSLFCRAGSGYVLTEAGDVKTGCFGAEAEKTFFVREKVEEYTRGSA